MSTHTILPLDHRLAHTVLPLDHRSAHTFSTHGDRSAHTFSTLGHHSMANAGNSNPGAGGTSFTEQDSSKQTTGKELPPIPKKRKRSTASGSSSSANSLTSEKLAD